MGLETLLASDKKRKIHLAENEPGRFGENAGSKEETPLILSFGPFRK